MKAVNSSKMLVLTYNITRRHNTEDIFTTARTSDCLPWCMYIFTCRRISRTDHTAWWPARVV